EAVRTHNQKEIEAALANPDLVSADDAKRAAAEKDRQDLRARVQQLDAIEKQTVATVQGQDPKAVVGRTIDQQISDHYKEVIAKDPELTDPAAMITHAATRSEDRKNRETQAKEDHYATDELLAEGKLSTVTQVRRADKQEKANLLEGVQHNAGKG